MKRPTEEQFNIACQWLAYNEGEGHEGDACRAVAAWLKEQSDQRFLRVPGNLKCRLEK